MVPEEPISFLTGWRSEPVDQVHKLVIPEGCLDMRLGVELPRLCGSPALCVERSR